MSPAWVGNPACQALLGRLLDKQEAANARGSSFMQPMALTSKTWPELFNQVYESDKEALWQQLCQLCALGWLSLTPKRLQSAPGGYEQAVKVAVLNEELVRKATGRLSAKESRSRAWKEAVHQHLKASADVKQVVAGYLIEVPTRSPAEVVQRLNALSAETDTSLMLREVSAKLFWGHSKVLDGRQRLVCALLGLDECPFPESAIFLHVCLPKKSPTEVLFIENQVSFERAMLSGSDRLSETVLVYSAGFKGAGRRLRHPEGVCLFYAGQGALGALAIEHFENWLFGNQGAAPLTPHFWGDLDWSGMRILQALTAPFPGIGAWQPGYLPMLTLLQQGEGHAPGDADKQGQLPVESVSCPFANNRLIPALRESTLFVDQEALTAIP